MIAARHANVPQIPPMVHTDSEVHEWFATIVVPEQEVWIALTDQSIDGVLVTSPGWIEHLYVALGRVSAGIGSALLDHAKTQAGGPLDLWTFAGNVGARRFYERHGFVEVDRTDGDNEEGAPDIRYRFTG